MAKVVFIVGDIHGNFKLFNRFIDDKIRKNPALRLLAEEDGGLEIIILQVGDLAYYWPGYDSFMKIDSSIPFAKSGRAKIYWCGGNHDDWDALDRLFMPERENGIAEIENEFFFCRFGATLDLTADIRILFCGGAESVDKLYRLRKMAEGCPKIWWKQEGISDEDMARLDCVLRADWVVSHTAPMLFDIAPFMHNLPFTPGDEDNISRYKLDGVELKFKPKRWFFGHFHRYMSGIYANCQWEGLADIACREKWWNSMRVE